MKKYLYIEMFQIFMEYSNRLQFYIKIVYDTFISAISKQTQKKESTMKQIVWSCIFLSVGERK